MIGLIGSHRTGKTSLAKAYAEQEGILFLETSVSAIFKELGYDPAVTYDFGTRMEIQEQVLNKVDAIYAKHAGEKFIADRTPIDMAAYLLGDAIGDRVPEEYQERVAAYVNRCYEIANKRFGIVTLIQPGIVIQPAEGKAVPNKAYIEHLSSLMFGLMVDERLTAARYYIPRATLDMDKRLKALKSSVKQATNATVDAYEQLKADGMVLH